MPTLFHPILAGFIAAVSGFATSFVVVLAGLAAVGATPGQASSGLFALCIAIAITSVIAALVLRVPLAIAWSTPGAAVLLGTSGGAIRFSDAIGAFLISAALMVLSGLWRPLGRAIVAIPRPLATAMLAGVLLPICLSPVEAVATIPLLAGPVVLVWLVLFRLAPRWAVPAAMLTAVVAVIAVAGTDWIRADAVVPRLEFVAPTFDLLTIISLGIPLFIVTMAGQNVPGFAVLTTYGYPTHHRFALVSTGLGSAAGALFGAHAINLGAITAAMMVAPESHPDPAKRWVATLTNGLAYIPLGLVAALAGALVTVAPTILITAVAGLAVLGTLITSIVAALEDPRHRISAIVTFLVVASGIVVVGIGSAFWGLLVGGIVMAWLGWRSRRAQPAAEEPATQDSE